MLTIIASMQIAFEEKQEKITREKAIFKIHLSTVERDALKMYGSVLKCSAIYLPRN